MKDTLTYKQILARTAESIHRDLNGIEEELGKYTSGFGEDQTSVKADTIFTVVVTISIFVLGIIIDRILKYCDRKKSEKERREYFLFHLNRANTKLISKLKNLYEDYSKDDLLDKGLTSTPPKVISSDYQRLLNTNYEDLFKAFKNKELLSRTQSQIEFVQEVIHQVNGFHSRVYIESGEVREHLAKITDEYLGLLGSYTKNEKTANATYQNSETYKLINDSLARYYTDIVGTRQLSTFYSDIVRKIQEKIVATGEYQTNPQLAFVAEKGRQLSHVVSRLKQILREVSTQYQNFSDYMRDANIELSTDIPKLQ